ncbi:1090_t:CDS:2, partial [Ambispora leptoticha]
MTRYAKLEKKRYKEAVGFEGFNIKPLTPSKSKSSTIKKEREQTVVAMDEDQFKEKSIKTKSSVKRKVKAEIEDKELEFINGINKSDANKQKSKRRKIEEKVDNKIGGDDHNIKHATVKNTDVKLSRSEKRRLRRIKERKSKTICFACRKPGHGVKDCPEANKHGDAAADESISVGICYTCGSTEHTSKNCKKLKFSKDDKSLENIKYRYAKCFICGEQGHLSGKCPKNEKGLYPNGGSCRFCGKVDHFAKDCDIKKEEIGVVALSKIDTEHGPDDDDFHIFIKGINKSERMQRMKEKINTTSTKITNGSLDSSI